MMSAQSTIPPQAPPAARPTAARAAARIARGLAESPEAGVVLACVVVFIVISINAPTYASGGNLQVMGRDLSQVGILALGESLVILTGGIDLSVGALAGLAGILAAWFNVNQGMPAPAAILFTLAICAGVGFLHGALVTRLINAGAQAYGIGAGIGRPPSAAGLAVAVLAAVAATSAAAILPARRAVRAPLAVVLGP